MPYVTKEQISTAKRMDLLTYLQNFEPQELVHIRGDMYCTRTHDSLKISNGKWCWWSRGIGGRSALDYLIKVRGMVFTDAVKYLCKCTRYAPTPVYSKKPKPRSIFDLPKQNTDNDRVLSYLTERSIDLEVIRSCIDTGRLYEDWRHNCVFVGFDKGDAPRYAMLRGTSSNSTFMMDVSGSDKRYSFSIPAQEENNTVFLFESAIDIMSYATIMKMKGQDWRSINYLSLAGVYLPKKSIKESTVPLALAQYLKDNPETQKIVLCLDNDRTGREAAKAITAILQEQYEVGDSLFKVIACELARGETNGSDAQIAGFVSSCAANIVCKRCGVDVPEYDQIPESVSGLSVQDKRSILGKIREAACDINERIDKNLYAERQQRKHDNPQR